MCASEDVDQDLITAFTLVDYVRVFIIDLQVVEYFKTSVDKIYKFKSYFYDDFIAEQKIFLNQLISSFQDKCEKQEISLEKFETNKALLNKEILILVELEKNFSKQKNFKTNLITIYCQHIYKKIKELKASKEISNYETSLIRILLVDVRLKVIDK
jgi:hypothetical protein